MAEKNPEAETTVEGSEETPSKGETKEELKARLAGLDSTFSKKQSEWSGKFEKQQNVIADLTTKTKDYETELAQLKAQLGELGGKQQEWQKQVESLQTEAATSKQRLERQSIFMQPPEEGGFSDLSSFEAKSLLRQDLSGDDLKKYLSEFRDAQSKRNEATTRKVMEGAVPPAGAGKQNGDIDAETLSKQMEEAISQGKWADFDRLNEAYVRLAAKG